MLDLSNEGITFLELPDENLDHIQFLNLKNNHLYVIPDNIDVLTNLSDLYADSNQLISLPISLWRLKKLQTLTISHNQIEKLPDSFSLLSSLKYFNGSYNKLIQLPAGFWGLPLLNTLNLRANELTSLPDENVGITSLINIDVSYNGLDTFPAIIPKLFILKNINLSNNSIQSLPDDIIRLAYLEDLDLSYNNLNSLPVNISSLLSLQNLDLSYNVLERVPEKFFNLLKLRIINLTNNHLIELPKGISNLNAIHGIYLSNNRLTQLPDDVGLNPFLATLLVSNNLLESLPDSIGKLLGLRDLNLSNNKLTVLPPSFAELKNLFTLNIRNNNIEVFPDELKALESSYLLMDYRNNPFLERALLRSQRFTKIWQEAPFHLREILKIYFNGFNTFYSQRTHQQIEFNVRNETDGLVFEVVPNDDTDPDVVNSLLTEYFEILKSKLHEGADKGYVYPNSSADPADFFAQVQASNFALNATQAKLSVNTHVDNQDVFISVSKNLDAMEADYGRMTRVAKKLYLDNQQKEKAIIRLETKAEDLNSEVGHRRLEAQTRASLPMTINVQQQVLIKQEIGNDFSGLRELLDPFLSDFKRREGNELQKEIDAATEKHKLAPEEKKTLGKSIKRWIEGTKDAVKMAKEAGSVGADLLKGYDKLKDFAEGVLQDPVLADTIESIKQMAEGLM